MSVKQELFPPSLWKNHNFHRKKSLNDEFFSGASISGSVYRVRRNDSFNLFSRSSSDNRR